MFSAPLRASIASVGAATLSPNRAHLIPASRKGIEVCKPLNSHGLTTSFQNVSKPTSRSFHCTYVQRTTPRGVGFDSPKNARLLSAEGHLRLFGFSAATTHKAPLQQQTLWFQYDSSPFRQLILFQQDSAIPWGGVGDPRLPLQTRGNPSARYTYAPGVAKSLRCTHLRIDRFASPYPAHTSSLGVRIFFPGNGIRVHLPNPRSSAIRPALHQSRVTSHRRRHC